MAKYNVTYACGHEGIVNLVGKTSERERKLDWLTYQNCWRCEKKEKDEADAKKPIKATVRMTGTVNDGKITLEIALTGGTINRKDDIKAAGFRWTEPQAGVFNLLSTKVPDKCWVKNYSVPLDVTEESLTELFRKNLEPLGVEETESKISQIDVAMMKKSAEKEEEKKEKTNKLVKPEKPESHPTNKGGKWNGNYYGKKGNRNFYVDGKNYEMTDEEYDECMVYRKKMEDYNTAVKAIKEGNF